MPGFSPANLKHDLIAGLTAALVALPLALAFGVASGLGAGAGLAAAIIGGFLAALLGGTELQVSGPTAPMTVMVAAIVIQSGQAAAFQVIILAGIIQVLFSGLKLGRLIEFLPYTVISGFMTGVAILIFTSQWNSVVFSAPAFLLFALLLALMAVLSKVQKAIPPGIIVLICGTLIGTRLNVPILGSIPSNIFSLTSVSISPGLLIAAFSLALLASIDSLLTSVIADKITKTRHNSDRELFGQGIANLASGLFGGIAVAGATVRTLVNIKSGAKSRLSGIIHSLALLAIVLLFADFAKLIPLAAIAAILVYVAFTIIDLEGLKSVAFMPIEESAVMLITISVTVVYNLIAAVILGLVLASFLFLKQMTQLQVVKVPVGQHFSPEEMIKMQKLQSRVGIYQINGPLFFGSSRLFARSMEEVGPARVIILKLFAVTAVDHSGIKAFEEIIEQFQKSKVRLLLCNIQPQPYRLMESAGLIQRVGKHNIFDNPRKAVLAAEKMLKHIY